MKIKSWIKDNKLYIGLFIFYLCIHLFIHLDYWDDKIFRDLFISYNYDLIALEVYRWNEWTSRALIHGLACIFLVLPSIVWKICDSLIWVWIFIFLNKLVGVKNHRLIGILLFLSYPLSMMATAGWVATSTGYNFPIAFVLWALLLLFTDECQVKVYEVIIGCAAFIYGCNFELMAYTLVLLLVVVLFIPSIRDRINKRLAFVYLTIAIISSIYPLICPGNFVRINQTDSLSFIDSIRMGINTCFYYFCSVPNAVFFLFNALIMVASMLVGRTRKFKIIAIVPLAIDVIWTAYFFVRYTVTTRQLTYVYPDAEFISHSILEQSAILISALIWVGVTVYILICLFDDEWIPMLSIFIISLAPEVILGFTNGVTPSMIRVSIFMYLGLIAIGIKLSDKYYVELRQNSKLYGILVTISTMGMLFSLAQTVRHILVYG